ncbi:MAG: ABC transporter ATP-binding protein [Thermoproteota archaeon]|jgi:ABC-type cobalt transport system, ATPase component
MIEFRQVYFRYPFEDEFAIKNINLRIEKGECVFIMGSNGAGKTTLIKHMNGILKPTKGDVYINGKNTKDATVAELSRIVGIVFQNPDHQLFESTVFDEISFALKNFGFEKEAISERVNEMLKVFSLEKYKEFSPFFLSGGEKKRVTIASVLCYEPDFLVLDEPTVGLDFLQRKTLISLIKQIKENKKSVIVATHDIDFAIELADRIIIMKEGMILKNGKVSEIVYDAQVLQEANLIQPIIVQIVKNLKNIKLQNNILTVDDFIKSSKIIMKNV